MHFIWLYIWYFVLSLVLCFKSSHWNINNSCFHGNQHNFQNILQFVLSYWTQFQNISLVLAVVYLSFWPHNARVNSHQRWKQTRFRVCFHLWCELTSTINVREWQVSWNSWHTHSTFIDTELAKITKCQVMPRLDDTKLF